MKHYTKLFFAAAVAALGLASCAKEVAPVETPKDNLVTVHFGATAGIEGATKATLTPDEQETLFTSAWESGDVLSVKYSNDNETAGATTNGTVSASWSTDHFEATMPEYKGWWDYNVVYPAPDTESAVDFGSTRTQKGNAYNSKYDLMKGSAIEENADAGKTSYGKDIVFNMTRQTAIAYFHFTSALDEDVVSAKLSVEGKDAYLSTSDVQIGKDNSGNIDYAKGYTFTETEGVASKEINLTFTGEAPRSSDFKLWFNVLPTIYDKMTLTVETTNNTLTISRTAEGMYEAGKLYKVVKKEIPAEKWAPKAAYTGGDLVFNFKTHPKGWPAEENKNAGNYDYELSGVKYAFNLSTNVYCKGTSGDNGYLMISGKNDNALLGLPAISGFKLTKIVATINDQVTTISSKTMVAITDGVNVVAGGVAQNWKTKGAAHTYTLTETEENTVYYMYATKANAQMMKLVLSYEPATHRIALDTPANLQVSAKKVVSWDAVSGAASYEVTIGENTFASETTSYDAAAIADDYYDASVIAVPSDKDKYKNSAAATLNGAKFGTPTLATPTLKEGVIDGASISVSWSVDERATAGYNCELFKGGVKVGESQTVNAGAVTFTGLDAETVYVVKVNAIAVEGAKAYAASSVATLDVTTKAASATANDGSLERPYTAAEAIAAIDANTDLTGKHVKGIVKATPSFNATYSSLSYDIESGGNTLYIYSGKDLGNAGFVGAEDLKAGDEVVVYGDLKLYKNNNKTTYELDKNNHLISINGETQIYRGLAVSEPKTAFNVGDTFELGGKVLQVWRGKKDVDVTASATFSGYNMSTEGKQTVTVTVGDESVTYAIYVRAAGSETAKTYTLQFGKTYNSEGISSYEKSWTVTCDGFTWDMVNWNNNNNGWTYVKAGSKKFTSVATITTNTTMPEAISTVTMTIDAITATNVNSIKLEVLPATGTTAIETISGTIKQGDCVFQITNPQQGCKYKITVDCQKGSSNGLVQISKVVYTNN